MIKIVKSLLLFETATEHIVLFAEEAILAEHVVVLAGGAERAPTRAAHEAGEVEELAARGSLHLVAGRDAGRAAGALLSVAAKEVLLAQELALALVALVA